MLHEHKVSHRRIKPHCPEENGLMERANRTIDEALEGEGGYVVAHCPSSKSCWSQGKTREVVELAL